MMGMMQNQNMPTIKELWKDEKSKYRHWILLFGIGMMAVLGLLIASLVLNVQTKGDIVQNMIDKIQELYKEGTPQHDGAADTANSIFNSTYIILPAIQMGLVAIGLLLFITTVVQSYREKNFGKLSGVGTMVIGIGALFSVYQLFSLIWSGSRAEMFSTPGGIFQFITYFVILGVYFGGSSQVSRIRRTFLMSARMEALKKDPNYQNMMQQAQAMMNGQAPGAQNMGPFGPKMGTAQGNPAQGNPAQATPQPTGPVKSQEEKDLEGMSVQDLKAVATKLSISGVDTMTKPELIKAILRVTSQK